MAEMIGHSPDTDKWLALIHQGKFAQIKWDKIPPAQLQLALVTKPDALQELIASSEFRNNPESYQWLVQKNQVATLGLPADDLIASGNGADPDLMETGQENQEGAAASVIVSLLTKDDLRTSIESSLDDHGNVIATVDGADGKFKVKEKSLQKVIEALQTFALEVLSGIKEATVAKNENLCTWTFFRDLMQSVINAMLKIKFHDNELGPNLLKTFEEVAVDERLFNKDRVIPYEPDSLDCLAPDEDSEDSDGSDSDGSGSHSDDPDYDSDSDDSDYDLDAKGSCDNPSKAPESPNDNLCRFIKVAVMPNDDNQPDDISENEPEDVFFTEEQWRNIVQTSLEKKIPTAIWQCFENIPGFASYAISYARICCGYTEDTEDNDSDFEELLLFVRAITDHCLQYDAEECEKTRTDTRGALHKTSQQVANSDPIMNYVGSNEHFKRAHKAALTYCAEIAPDTYRAMVSVSHNSVSEQPGSLKHLTAALSTQRPDTYIAGAQGVIATYATLTRTMTEVIRLLFVNRVPNSRMKSFWEVFFEDIEKIVKEHSDEDSYDNQKQLQGAYDLTLKTYLTCLGMFYEQEFNIRPGLLMPLDQQFDPNNSECPVTDTEFVFEQLLVSKEMSQNKSLQKFTTQPSNKECSCCKNANKPCKKENTKSYSVASDDTNNETNIEDGLSQEDIRYLMEQALNEFIDHLSNVCSLLSDREEFDKADLLQFVKHVLGDFDGEMFQYSIKQVCNQYCATNCTRTVRGNKVSTTAAGRMTQNIRLMTQTLFCTTLQDMTEQLQNQVDAQPQEAPEEEEENEVAKLSKEEASEKQIQDDKARMFETDLPHPESEMECNCPNPSKTFLKAYDEQFGHYVCALCEGEFVMLDRDAAHHPERTWVHGNVLKPNELSQVVYCPKCYFSDNVYPNIVKDPKSNEQDKADTAADSSGQCPADEKKTIALIKEIVQHLLKLYVKDVDESKDLQCLQSQTDQQLLATLTKWLFPSDERIKNFLQAYFDGLKGEADKRGHYNFESLGKRQGGHHSSCFDRYSKSVSVDESMRKLYHQIIQAHINDIDKLLHYDITTRCPCCEQISFYHACTFDGKIGYYAVKFGLHKNEYYCDCLCKKKIDVLLPPDMTHSESVNQMPFLSKTRRLDEKECAGRHDSMKLMLTLVKNCWPNMDKIVEERDQLRANRAAESDASPKEVIFTLALEVFGILGHQWDKDYFDTVYSKLADECKDGSIEDVSTELKAMTWDHRVCGKKCVKKLREDLEKLNNQLPLFLPYSEIFATPEVTDKPAKSGPDLKKKQADKRSTTKALKTTSDNNTRQDKARKDKINASRGRSTEEVACTPGVHGALNEQQHGAQDELDSKREMFAEIRAKRPRAEDDNEAARKAQRVLIEQDINNMTKEQLMQYAITMKEMLQNAQNLLP